MDSRRLDSVQHASPGPRRPCAWRIALAVLVTAGFALITACQAQTPPAAARANAPEAGQAQGAAAEAGLLEQIRAEVGQARCTDNAQCRSLGLGAKPCGGPASWLAWSVGGARAERLDAWSAELAMLQRQRQQASGMVSNCQYLADPGAVCQAGRCVLQSGSARR